MKTERPSPSYFELTALPQLRARFLASEPAVLFDSGFSSVLWCNASAPQMFDAKDIAALLGSRFDEADRLVRQLRDAAAQIEDGEPVIRAFRISRAGKTTLAECMLDRFVLPGGGEAVLLTTADERLYMRLREHEAARQAVAALATGEQIAAILDGFGLPLAYSPAFAEADLAPETIEAMTSEALAGRQPVHGMAEGIGGARLAIKILPLVDRPARVLLLEAGAAQAETAPAMKEPGVPATTSREVSVQPVPGADAARRLDANAPASEPEGEPEGAIDIDDILEPVTQAMGVQDELPLDQKNPWPGETTTIRRDAEAERPGERTSPIVLQQASRGEDIQPEVKPAEVRQEPGMPDDGLEPPARASARPSASMLEKWYLGERAGLAEGEEPKGGTEQFASIEAGPTTPPRQEMAREIPSATTGPTIPVPAVDDARRDASPAVHAGADHLAGPSAGAEDAFRFRAVADPVRFAWTVDDNQVFLSVSPELGRTVGPNAADIVGRRWSDVAKVFGFDRSGDIQRLLEKRDTWSGKSVLWPIQGTELAAPVDLAALPAFSSARRFDGFRGFGIIRTADAILDPDETGLALVSGPVRGVDSKSDPNSGEAGLRMGAGRGTAAAPNRPDEMPQAPIGGPANANVVELSARKRERGEELSKSEVRAFQEIGRKLGEDLPQTEAGNAPATRADAAKGTEAELPEVDSKQSSTQSSILRQLPVPVLVYRSGEVLYANPELLSVTGYASGRELQEAGGVDALFSHGSPIGGEKGLASLRCKDGSGVEVSPLLQSVPWDDGKALLLTFRMPAGAPSAEKAAIDIARVAELQNILDTATDGILVTSGDGKIESLNGPAEALFGVTHADIAGRSLEELFAPESRRAVLEYLLELKEPGVAGLINNGREVIGHHAKGGLIPLFITLGKVGREEKYCAVLRDITPWKKTEEELVSARRAAESASEQKSEFLARVSHEIRTPLNAIIGFSDVMIEERFGPIENERYRGYLRDINRSGVHVLDLINDLLDISKIEAGKMELTYEAVDLNQLVSETVALLQPQANSDRIIIRTSLSRAVPRVVADARSIRQIILNLVSNAIKFTPANGQVIVSTVYEGNGEVVMRVRDTGRGMTEREIEHAMKPFQQVHVTDDRRGHGTGLGLPLTKALVEANRAYFDLESTPGEGTIAHVHFPTQRVLAD
jgi:PAS domain S-box-containing protein